MKMYLWINAINDDTFETNCLLYNVDLKHLCNEKYL